jgi:hypothetical protein
MYAATLQEKKKPFPSLLVGGLTSTSAEKLLSEKKEKRKRKNRRLMIMITGRANKNVKGFAK